MISVKNSITVRLNTDTFHSHRRLFMGAIFLPLTDLFNLNPETTTMSRQDHQLTITILLGTIFKTIRHDQFDFWDQLITELLNLSIQKPEYRKGIRKTYTVKLVNGEYKIVATDKSNKRLDPDEAYNLDDKKKFTRHQSTSYANPVEDYKPPYFGHSKDRSELLTGLSFDPNDCQFKRIMLYDGGTVSRPYDFNTREEAEKYISEKLEAGEYHTSLASLQSAGASHGGKRHNEVMAKLRWTERCAVTVFSSNLESRLLAQVRALDLKNRLTAAGLPNDVKITLYPDFVEYTSSEQMQDIVDVSNNADPTVKKYVNALQFLSNPTVLESEIAGNFDSWIHACILIQKTNPTHVNKLVEKICAVCRANPITSELKGISTSDLPIFLKLLSDDQSDIILKSICPCFQEISNIRSLDLFYLFKDISVYQCKSITRLIDVNKNIYSDMKDIDIDKRSAFCEALIEKMPDIQITVYDFSVLMGVAPTEEIKKQIYEKMKPVLMRLIDDSQFAPGYILESLSELQRNDLLGLTHEKVITLIKKSHSSSQFKYAFSELTDKYKIIIYKELQNELPNLIISANDFENVYPALLDSQKDVFFLLVKDKLNQVGFYKSGGYLFVVFKILSQSQRDEIFVCIKDRIIELMKSLEDWTFVNRALSDRQFEEVYTVIIKDQLPNLVTSVNELGTMLWSLSAEKSRIMCDLLKDIMLSKINTCDEFCQLMQTELSVDTLKHLYRLLHCKMGDFFRSINQFNRCLAAHWVQTKKDTFSELLKDNLLDILSIQTIELCQSLQIVLEEHKVLPIFQAQLNQRREQIENLNQQQRSKSPLAMGMFQAAKPDELFVGNDCSPGH